MNVIFFFQILLAIVFVRPSLTSEDDYVNDYNSMYFILEEDVAAVPPDAAATSFYQGMCINGWKTFNDRCYYFSGYRKSWNASENKCSELHPQAHLVSIVSKEEHEFISNNTGNSITWIGGNDIDTEGNWTWSDGRPWGYFKWHSNEPNNLRNEDCVVEWTNYWWDNPCNRNWPFVCSYALPGGCIGGDNCCKNGICREGEGDCDSSSDCHGDLICGTDNCRTGWSGDRSSFDATDDCCMLPPPVCNGGDNCCKNGNCHEGEGDCDSSSECYGNLVCGIDNCITGWSGDRSSFDATDDCCQKASGSCSSLINDKTNWSGAWQGELHIPLTSNISSYTISLETDTPVTSLKFWDGTLTGSNTSFSLESPSYFGGETSGDILEHGFQLRYSGSMEPVFTSIKLDGVELCGGDGPDSIPTSTTTASPGSLFVACDNHAEVFLDGVQITDPAMDQWDKTSEIILPSNTKTIAISCRNTEAHYGIKASTNSGIVTDGTWRCNNIKEDNWMMTDFDDSTWKFAKTDNLYVYTALSRPQISSSAEWIWSQIGTDRAYCRKSISQGSS